MPLDKLLINWGKQESLFRGDDSRYSSPFCRFSGIIVHSVLHPIEKGNHESEDKRERERWQGLESRKSSIFSPIWSYPTKISTKINIKRKMHT